LNLRRTDLGQRVSLDALLAEACVTSAARKLEISQPALSAQLVRLRDLFDDVLLVRKANRMKPTPRAADLSEPQLCLLDELRPLLSSGSDFDQATARRSLHLVDSELSPTFIPAPEEKQPNHR
jgi:DNA-binding transcriptional LysR family regulator